MRNKIFYGGMAVFGVVIIVCLIIYIVRVTRNDEHLKYEAEVAGYKKEIEMLNSRETLKSILIDSLPAWREQDKRAIIRELEDIQDNIEYYGDIQSASPQKVDKMYQKAIKELVDKYKNGELEP
jgi:predicted sugar kinase